MKHLPAAILEAHLLALAPPPDQRAVVERLVLRLPHGLRECPARVVLDPREGAVGDRWSRGLRPKLYSQVTLMRADVAALFCGGDDYELLGDNVFATLDTSASNLPPGTRLRLGTALCEVTPKPHTGCARFAERVGKDALALTRAPAWRAVQLRGVHLQILEAGEVAVGEAIEVVGRSSA